MYPHTFPFLKAEVASTKAEEKKTQEEEEEEEKELNAAVASGQGLILHPDDGSVKGGTIPKLVVLLTNEGNYGNVTTPISIFFMPNQVNARFGVHAYIFAYLSIVYDALRFD